ncbi:hypothetical protein [Saccharopolyspora tripterygii]
MSRRPQGKQPATTPLVQLIRHVVGCDDRTRRATTLILVTASAAAVLLLLAITAVALLGPLQTSLLTAGTAVTYGGYTLIHQRRL